ncbi:MAG: hypothetical protein SFV18_01550 [Bryobacteraceae bacterium]|nr:hypothetical protein [Bryobacteraceae bacterium]
MSVLKPRNRLVNFRLGEEEFNGMKAACEKSGARSLSDFARGAVLRAMAEAESGVVAAGPLGRLDGVVTMLESRVEQLLRLLEGVEGASRQETEVRVHEPAH